MEKLFENDIIDGMLLDSSKAGRSVELALSTIGL
jgi:hypothetical protein